MKSTSQFSARRGGTNQLAKPLRNEFVSGNYFGTFGVQAYAGRTLTPADDQPSAGANRSSRDSSSLPQKALLAL